MGVNARTPAHNRITKRAVPSFVGWKAHARGGGHMQSVYSSDRQGGGGGCNNDSVPVCISHVKHTFAGGGCTVVALVVAVGAADCVIDSRPRFPAIGGGRSGPTCRPKLSVAVASHDSRWVNHRQTISIKSHTTSSVVNEYTSSKRSVTPGRRTHPPAMQFPGKPGQNIKEGN